MQLFECSIFTFANEVLNRKVQSVKFTTLNDGQLMILHGHEDAMFFLSVGKITVQLREVKESKESKQPQDTAYDLYASNAYESTRSFYTGSGYVKIENGKVFIFAFPVLAEGALDHTIEAQMQSFGEYGQRCLSVWRAQ